MRGRKGGHKPIPSRLHLLQGGHKKTHRPLPENEPKPHMFTRKEIEKIFKLDKAGRQLLTERLKLEKLREKERKEFTEILKSWVKKWDKKKSRP